MAHDFSLFDIGTHYPGSVCSRKPTTPLHYQSISVPITFSFAETNEATGVTTYEGGGTVPLYPPLIYENPAAQNLSEQATGILHKGPFEPQK